MARWHDGNGTRVVIVNAFTTVNPETEATVRAVDYQVVGAAEQFRIYSDDAASVLPDKCIYITG